MAETVALNDIKVVAFDWNGTLVSMDALIERDKLLAAHYGQDHLSEAQIRALMTKPAAEVYAGLTGQPNITPKQIDNARNQLQSYSTRHPRRAVEGAAQVLGALTAAGLYTGVFTGGRMSSVYEDAEQAGLSPRSFTFFNTGGTQGADSEGVKTALRRTVGRFVNGVIGGTILKETVPASSFLVVGDEPNDMRTALGAGVENYLILSSGTMRHDQLLEGGVPGERIIADIRELPGLLGIEPLRA